MDDASAFEVALGDEVRAWRRRRRITLEELAEKSGVSRSTLQRLEAGTHSTSVPNTWAIARALDVPLATLVRRAEEAMDESRLRAEISASSEQDEAARRDEAERLDISFPRYAQEFGFDFELAQATLQLERLRAKRQPQIGVADLAARDEDER